MKSRILTLVLTVAAFGAGTLVPRTQANNGDDFSTQVLDHGVAFDYLDTAAEVESPPDPSLHPKSHFEPGRINLSDGTNPGIDVNGLPVSLRQVHPLSFRMHMERIKPKC